MKRLMHFVRGLASLLTVGALTFAGVSPSAAVCTQSQLLQNVSLRSVGSKPRGVILVDLNHDGILDIVATGTDNLSSGFGTSVVVMLGNGSGGVGDGTFAGNVSYSAGSRPMMLVSGDFDGDTKPDVATANWNNNGISILHGNGDGTFAAPTNIAVGVNPYAIATADFNHDGILDLAMADNGIARVYILLGQGSGGVGNGNFAAPVPYTIADLSTDLVIGDLDHDNNPDLIATCNYSGVVSVLKGNANGSFQPATTYPAGIEPFALALRDFDGDGNLDLVAGNAQSYGAAFLKGNGLGGFAAPVVQGAGFNIAGISVGDFNQDGIQDLAAAFNTGNSVSLLLGLGSGGIGNGSFAAQASYPSGAFPLGIASADLNGDGYRDVVTASFSSGAIGILLGGCTGAPPPPQVPHLVSVKDVPNDQGGQVFLRWTKSSADVPGTGTVTGYRVWRRLPPGLAATAASGKPGDARSPGLAQIGIDYWEAIAALPAEGLAGYGYTAPTTQDSMTGSNPYTAFFVTALTGNAGVFYESNVDSGYSVDNLAPPTPAPFVVVYTGIANQAHWSASRAADLREFRLYRGTNASFVPSPATLVVATRDTGYVDGPGVVFYKLIAVDVHGNASHVAIASPEAPVAALAALVGIESAPEHIRLTWYSGDNPGLQATVYRRTEQTTWESMGSIVADGTGYMRYDDSGVASGTRYGYRLGIVDGGEEVFTSEAWARTEAWALRLEGVRPNPAPAGRMTVQFVLRDGAPALLEAFDVGGRRVVVREVGGLGAGRHTVDLTEGRRMPAGLYLIRLHQGAMVQTARAVVLD